MNIGLMQPPPLGGWTRSQLIELADRRTERRGSKTLDLDSEFLMALQCFCTETRWSWRRKTSIFTLRAGVWQYDLSTVLPEPADNAISAQATWQIEKAMRAGGFDYLFFPPGTVIPNLTPGQTVYILSDSNFSFNGPVVITQPGTNNLLSNPSFESGMNGWIGNGMALVNSPVYSGTQALELGGALITTVAGQTQFPLTAGVSTTVSVRVYIAAYGGTSPVDAALVTYDATGNAVNAHIATADTTIIGSWQLATWTFTPTSTELFGQVFLEINKSYLSSTPGPVQAVFDSVSVVQGAGPNLVGNGDFESGLSGWTRTGLSIVNAPVHSGTSALQISSNEDNCSVTQPQASYFALTAGVPVEATAWVYVAAYAGTKEIVLAVATYNALGVAVAYHFGHADITKIGVWQQVQLTFTPTPTEVNAQILCMTNVITTVGETAGQVTVIFDDIDMRMAVVGTQAGVDTTMWSGGPQDVMGLQPFSYIIPPNARDFHQFCKHGVKFFPNPGNATRWAEITPLFERELQTAAIYTNNTLPIPAPPRQYFIMPGAFLVLCVTPVPDQDYPIMIDYWCCPNNPPDSSSEQIPLVPAFLHHVLLKRLEAQIFRYTLGEGAAKYQAAMAEYTALVSRYQGMDGMVPGEQTDYSDDDDYTSNFTNDSNAVQSTV